MAYRKERLAAVEDMGEFLCKCSHAKQLKYKGPAQGAEEGAARRRSHDEKERQNERTAKANDTGSETL